MSAQAAELVRTFQEIDNFMQFRLSLVDTGHVVERHFNIGFSGHQLCFAATDGEQAASHAPGPTHAAGGEHPNAHKQQRRYDPGKNRGKRATGRHAAVFDFLVGQRGREVARHRNGGERGLSVGHGLGQRTADAVAIDDNLLHLAGIQIGLKLAVGDRSGVADIGKEAERGHGHEAEQNHPDSRGYRGLGRCRHFVLLLTIADEDSTEPELWSIRRHAQYRPV